MFLTRATCWISSLTVLSGLVLALYAYISVSPGESIAGSVRVVMQVMVSHLLGHNVNHVHRVADVSFPVKHHKKPDKFRGESEEGFLISALSNSNSHP